MSADLQASVLTKAKAEIDKEKFDQAVSEQKALIKAREGRLPWYATFPIVKLFFQRKAAEDFDLEFWKTRYREVSVQEASRMDQIRSQAHQIQQLIRELSAAQNHINQLSEYNSAGLMPQRSYRNRFNNIYGTNF